MKKITRGSWPYSFFFFNAFLEENRLVLYSERETEKKCCIHKTVYEYFSECQLKRSEMKMNKILFLLILYQLKRKKWRKYLKDFLLVGTSPGPAVVVSGGCTVVVTGHGGGTHGHGSVAHGQQTENRKIQICKYVYHHYKNIFQK